MALKTRMLIAALLAIVWQCQKRNMAHLSSERMDNKWWHIHTVKLHTVKRSSITWIILKTLILISKKTFSEECMQHYIKPKNKGKYIK